MIFQKPLSPAHVRTTVEANRDSIAGFVLNAADVAQVKSPRELYEAHGLGFPGSPWDPAADYLDVLRFEAPPSVHVHSATMPEFVDRPPFTGTGFARWGGGGGGRVFRLLYTFWDALRPVSAKTRWVRVLQR